MPIPRGLRFQAVHSHDIGHAYALAVTTDAHGPFNLAAEPVIDRSHLAELFDARVVAMPPPLVRAGLAVGWHARMLPAAPELFDAVMHLPLLDTGRARAELGWAPRYTAVEALRQLLAGLRAGAGEDTPPLVADAGGPWRWREFLSGAGGRELLDQHS
ncbi:hypothetical protein OH799_05195 [Nocardia sp. NBC_00881]|uniref:hypothetical protein n=1 Tax=Nocardia sp. NBC_00881 TaxID=2975995 RepID=UPI00386521E3|nr:hypothetical protein OH799_05195 [Nocardia sp. NBC_00881]